MSSKLKISGHDEFETNRILGMKIWTKPIPSLSALKHNLGIFMYTISFLIRLSLILFKGGQF